MFGDVQGAAGAMGRGKRWCPVNLDEAGANNGAGVREQDEVASDNRAMKVLLTD